MRATSSGWPRVRRRGWSLSRRSRPAPQRRSRIVTFWFRLATHHPWPWLKAHGLDIGLVEMWGSVLTAAFEIACLAGCDPIVFVGSDLAYTGGRPYCRGTSYEFDWAFDVATGASLDAVWQHRCALGESQMVPDLRGAPTLSKSHLVSFRDWLVTRAARSGRRVINASGEGILHGSGIEQAPLDAAVGARRAIPPARAIATPREPQESLEAALNETRVAVERATSISPVREWEEFCSGGFDAAQVSDALAAAASGSDGLAGASIAFPAMPALDLDAHAATRWTLATLPEGAARFRQAFAGAAMPRGTVEERAALLADAFALLTEVQAAVGREPDLAEPADERRFGRTPIGPPCWWSEPIRWSVHAFEALVGEAWVAAPENPPHVPFWSPPESQVREPIPSSDHPHSDRAMVLLAGEWMMAVAGQVAGSDPAETLVAWWRWIAARLAAIDATAPAPTCQASVAIVVRGDRHDDVLRWPMVIGATEWLRLRTGALTRGAEPIRLARLETGGLAVSLEIEAAGAGAPAVISRSSPAVLVPPHVLTDRGLPRGIVAYGTGQGVVCVTAHAQRSVIVAPDGTSRTHHEWPRSIVFELPFGHGGAIAWSNGCGRWPSIEPAYVMFRRCAGDEVMVEDLPFRPALGTWWRDRVWFACYPAGVGAWTGVASWRPGSVPTLDYPGVLAIALRSEGDALVIEPGVPAEEGGFRPQRPATPWRSSRRRRLGRAKSNPDGACSSRATAGGWTASAFPHADLVRVTPHEGAAIDLVCEAAFGLGWAGSSLIVSTRKRDVLLFPDLISRLDEALGREEFQ